MRRDQVRKGSTTRSGYGSSTYKGSFVRFSRKSQSETFTVETLAGFRHVSSFLGNNWNLASDHAKMKGMAMSGEFEHCLGDFETFGAIVDGHPATIPSADEELEDNDLAAQLMRDYGIINDEEERPKSRRPLRPNLTLKYSPDLRLLSIRVCWLEGPFSTFSDR